MHPNQRLTVRSVTPFLWYQNDAEAAARHYTTIFANSRIVEVTPLVVTFEIAGQRLMGLNGGPQFRLSEAFSLMIRCVTQEEVDFFWERLGEGGEPGQCGWLKDRFGLSWQVIPEALLELLDDDDPAVAQRTMAAMLTMAKLDVARLRAAARGYGDAIS